jgi:hypothetical protein
MEPEIKLWPDDIISSTRRFFFNTPNSYLGGAVPADVINKLSLVTLRRLVYVFLNPADAF